VNRARPDLVIIGPGRVGTALARALQQAGWSIRAVAGRRARSLARTLGPAVSAHRQAARAVIRGDAVLLALPHEALADLAASLPEKAVGRRIFLHTSGGAPDDALDPLRTAGAATGRLHPLYPFTGRDEDAEGLRGASFAVSGNARAVALGARLTRSLGGKLLRLPPGGETAYHLSAVLASNLVVALTAEAARLGPHWGQTPADALEALLPLLQAAVDQLQHHGLPGALTGPLVRAESGTVRAQLELLQRAGHRDLAEIYRLLSRTGVDLALQGGHLDARQGRALKRLLGAPKSSRKSD
jgi:predicted short-subunit dehydrogenase-like oxidoreductase (DUF2520 family)